MSDTQEFSGRAIVLNQTPMVCWDQNHGQTQLTFLESIDPEFFLYQSEVHSAMLDTDRGMKAAVAIRVAYSHALESLFALMCTAIQAPNCPAAWMLRYKYSDVVELVRNIQEHQAFPSKLDISHFSWPEVATALFPWEPMVPEIQHTISATAKVLSILAKDVIDTDFIHEYNGIKHGLRVKSGDSYFSIGREDRPGVAAPPVRMRMLAQSDYGSIFLNSVYIKKYQWSFEQKMIHWDPKIFVTRLPIVVACIQNIKTFLLVTNGAPSETSSLTLLAKEHEELVTTTRSSSFRFTMRVPVMSEGIQDLSKEEILNHYGVDDGSSPDMNLTRI